MNHFLRSGRGVLMLRLICFSPGDLVSLLYVLGVARCASNARYASSSVQSMFLTILTAHSAIPTDLGYSGLNVSWVNSHFLANCSNSKLENYGPCFVYFQITRACVKLTKETGTRHLRHYFFCCRHL